VAARAVLRARGIGFRERSERELTTVELQRIDTCWSVAAGLGMVDNIRGADFQTRQALLALRAGEPMRVVRALALEAGFVAVAGVPATTRVEDLLRRAGELAARVDRPEATGFVTLARGIARFLRGAFKESFALSTEAEALLRDRCTGLNWEYDTASFFSLWSAFYLGQVTELRRRLQALRRGSAARGDLYALTNLRTTFTPFALLVDDQVDEAAEESRDAIAGWSRSGFHIQHCNATFSDVQTALYSGDGPRARELIEGRWPDLEGSMLLRVQQIRVRAIHFRGSAHAAAGDSAAAIEREARRLDREAPWARALGTLLHAAARKRRGDLDGAITLVDRAADELAAADLHLYAACAQRRHGALAGGEAGAAEIAAADDWLATQGIRNPDRMTSMLAPGL
jgi:hypothetical protein